MKKEIYILLIFLTACGSHETSENIVYTETNFNKYIYSFKKSCIENNFSNLLPMIDMRFYNSIDIDMHNLKRIDFNKRFSLIDIAKIIDLGGFDYEDLSSSNYQGYVPNRKNQENFKYNLFFIKGSDTKGWKLITIMSQYP